MSELKYEMVLVSLVEGQAWLPIEHERVMELVGDELVKVFVQTVRDFDRMGKFASDDPHNVWEITDQPLYKGLRWLKTRADILGINLKDPKYGVMAVVRSMKEPLAQGWAEYVLR
jgi:hypothetical protein